VGTERVGTENEGYVVTFDDITELVTAQRTAAWADVARRIAHEIKNPLTPIQLSAERLKRRYLKEITKDTEVFEQCTDTIVRQVADIGRMVDEFSSFARMPAPNFRTENLTEILKQEIFHQEIAHPEIAYQCQTPADPVMLRCDGRQMAQVLTNLLKNAAEGIEGRELPPNGGSLARGEIQVRVRADDKTVAIDVADNGRGLPVENRSQLTEPYITTRSKGTGLGLAIVKKIVEEHGGTLELRDAEGGGALVRLRLAVEEAPGEDHRAEESEERMVS
jgi:two-component system nitrogen regulation sensor histidine kinase NtrY